MSGFEDFLTPQVTGIAVALLVMFAVGGLIFSLFAPSLSGTKRRDQRMMAVARYVTNADGNSCEFALTVADEWQAKGAGGQLMERLMQAARANKQIFCEKPLSLTSASAKKMVKACRDRGLVLALGHERRYEPAWLIGRLSGSRICRCRKRYGMPFPERTTRPV